MLLVHRYLSLLQAVMCLRPSPYILHIHKYMIYLCTYFYLPLPRIYLYYIHKYMIYLYYIHKYMLYLCTDFKLPVCSL